LYETCDQQKGHGVINFVFSCQPGNLTLRDDHTTWGYILFQDDGGVDYIFVHPMYRNHGLGRFLLRMVEKLTSQQPYAATPVSEKGEAFGHKSGLLKKRHPGKLRENLT